MSAQIAARGSGAVVIPADPRAEISRQDETDAVYVRRNASGNPVKSVAHSIAGVASIIRSLPKRVDYDEVDLPDLAALAELHETVEAALHLTILKLRDRPDPWSWSQIGDALGITKQSAHGRFGS